MKLSKQQIRHLRSLAHHLKPIIMIGDKGASDNVLREIHYALDVHELIKVSIASVDKPKRRLITEKLCYSSRAILVQMIGRISILYRPKKDPKIII